MKSTVNQRCTRHTHIAAGVHGLIVAALWLGGWGVIVEACNVPVFRYALERWQSDDYRLTVFHRGPLSPTDAAMVGALQDEAAAGSLNVALRQIDVDQLTDDATDADARRWLTSLPNSAGLPWLVVQYPAALGTDRPLAAGPLAADNVQKLTRSPVRNELAQRLSDGHSAVWLLLASGHAEQDRAAEQLLSTELAKLEQELKLPALSDSADDTLLSDIPLRMSFSVLRLQRHDPAEQALVGQLLQSEPDLSGIEEPMVFPIFGRGRSLFALVGQGITSANLRDAAEQLTGACSCELKELNLGFDLLIAHNWNALLTASAAKMAPAKSRSTASREPVLVPIPMGSQSVANAEPAASDEQPAIRSAWLWGIAMGAIVVIAGWGLRWCRR